MIEVGIHDGGTLVVDRSLAVPDGDVVVAVVDDGPRGEALPPGSSPSAPPGPPDVLPIRLGPTPSPASR